jgi:rhamnosyltransferase
LVGPSSFIKVSDLPSFLVLLAARNGQDFIRQQLESILDQKDVRVSVLVRDDHSSDDTRNILTELALADKRLHLWHDHSPTGSASANFFELIRCAPLGGYEFVAFSDQDDIWLPEKLSRAANALSTQQMQGYSSAVQAFWPGGRERLLLQSPKARMADYLFEGAGQGCTFVIAARLFLRFRESLCKHSEWLPSLHFHDWAIYAMARSAGESWHFDPIPTMLYRQHQGNDTGARSSGLGIGRRILLIRLGWYRAQVRAVANFVLASNPGDYAASTWIRLSTGDPRKVDWRGRLARAYFVARHGRRRISDRCVLVLAVACGYL